MIPAPFTLSNEYYSYKTLTGENILKGNAYYLLYQFNGESQLVNHSNIKLFDHDFIEFAPQENVSVNVKEGMCLLLSKPICQLSADREIFTKGNVLKNSYKVTKPWGFEYWITGEKPINDVVLKYIQIKKGTKTSLQVHQEKYESNFLVSGEAIFRTSDEKFSIKKEYPIKEYKLNSQVVIDVSPFIIHQLESISDINLVEASTNNLDDVIRLKDDSGRGDGRIDQEHK